MYKGILHKGALSSTNTDIMIMQNVTKGKSMLNTAFLRHSGDLFYTIHESYVASEFFKRTAYTVLTTQALLVQ